jgi:hypothetical protein
MPSAFLCGADSELYPVAPRLLAKRIETGRRTLSAPAKAAMPADLAWASDPCRTADSDSASLGSNPSPPAILNFILFSITCVVAAVPTGTLQTLVEGAHLASTSLWP